LEDMTPMLAALLETESWTQVGELKDCQAKSFCKDAEGGRLDVKCTGTSTSPLRNLAACLLHPELFATWMPGIKRSACLHRMSNFRLLIGVRLDTHWPLDPRDAVIVGYGDVYDERSVMVYIRTTVGDEYSEYTSEWEAQSRKDGCVRIDLKGGFLLQINESGGTDIATITKIDLKMKFLPSKVLDWIMKKVAMFFIPMIHKQSLKMAVGGSLHHHTEKLHVSYEEMHRRLNALEAKV